MARTMAHSALAEDAITAMPPRTWRVPMHPEQSATDAHRAGRPPAAVLTSVVPRPLRLLTLAVWIVAVS